MLTAVVLMAGLLSLASWTDVSAFPTGAPEFACDDLYPQSPHPSRSQPFPSPFAITFDPQVYVPGQSVTVRIAGLCGAQFKGFLLMAKWAERGRSQIQRLGTFTPDAASQVRCQGTESNALTHIDNIPKSSMVFTWVPPSSEQGHITFRATFMVNVTTYYQNVISSVLLDSRVASLGSVYPISDVINCPGAVTTSSPVAVTRFAKDAGCGYTQGCFHDCDATGCGFLVSWANLGSNIRFTIKAYYPQPGDIYMALGFSRDSTMGDDFVSECLFYEGRMTAAQSLNSPFKYNTPLNTNYLTLGEGVVEDGIFRCTFLQPVIGRSGDFPDLNTDFHLLLSRGNLDADGDKLKHSQIPYVSEQVFDFQATEDRDVTTPVPPPTTPSTTTPSTTTSTTTPSTTAVTAPATPPSTSSVSTASPVVTTAQPVTPGPTPQTTPSTTVTPRTNPPTTASTTPATTVLRTTATPAPTVNQGGRFPRDSACGISKSCIYDCDTTDCRFLVAWQPDGLYLRFQLKGWLPLVGDKYLSLSLSRDQSVGDEYVSECVYAGGVVTARQSYTNGDGSSSTVAQNSVDLLAGSAQSGMLECSFRQEVLSNLDLRNNYFLLLSWGSVSSDGSKLPPTETILTSGASVDLQTISERRFAPYSVGVVPLTLVRDADCGLRKGCFHDCGDRGCSFLVTWQQQGAVMVISLGARVDSSQDSYVALGFSGDNQMGSEAVTQCVYQGGSMATGQSYNEGNINRPNVNGVSLVSGEVSDGIFRCTFRQGVQGSLVDLNNDYFLFVAIGVPQQNGNLRMHSSLPHISPNAVDLQSTPDILLGESYNAPTTAIVTLPPGSLLPRNADCGVSKGCYSDCRDEGCGFQVTWQDLGAMVRFSFTAIMPGSGDKYLALGFSQDGMMGSDYVSMCASVNGRMVASQSYNQGRVNTGTLFESALTLESGSFVDGEFRCTFLQYKSPTTAYQPDLTQDFRLLFAEGDATSFSRVRRQTVASSGVRPRKHSKAPQVSSVAVDLQSTTDYAATPVSYTFVKVHGCLMVAAWAFLASIGLISARYFRNVLSKVAFWFKMHRVCMILTVLCVIAAFVVIFVDVKGLSKMEGSGVTKAHPIMGIVTTALVLVNPIMALMRPAPDASNRKVFNFWHRLVGTVVYTLASVTMFFGLEMARAGVPWFVRYILVGNCVAHALTSIILEVIMCMERRRHNTEADKKYQLGNLRLNLTRAQSALADKEEGKTVQFSELYGAEDENRDSPFADMKGALLTVHVIVIGCLAAAVMYFIVNNDY